MSLNFEFLNVQLSFESKVLFRNLNIQFSGPGIIGLLGPSGCGKSTLIRILAGLQEISSGEIKKPQNLKQGFIFQESHLLSWRNAFENVHLPLELLSLPNPDAALSALKSVGLQESLSLYPSELSGGMKMRVSLARAFVTEPHVLFCDEPFAALDEVTREALQIELRARVLKTQSLCFFVTHNLSEALSVSDQIYYFNNVGELHPKPFLVDRSLEPQAQLEELRSLVRGGFK